MVRALFFDIDGTLLSTGGHLLHSTKQALQEVRHQGILVGVATGRDPAKVSKLLQELPLDVYVTYNGQLVYTDQQVLYARAFEKAVLDNIVAYAIEHQCSINFGARDCVEGSRFMKLGQSVMAQRLFRFVPRRFPVNITKKLLKKSHFLRREDHYSQLAILKEPIYQCMMFSPVADDEKLAQALPQCDLLRSNSLTVDIVPKGGSKLRGIHTFLYEKGISPNDVMAFGDHLNDIAMLKGVGIGVAMGNGQPQVKAYADYVTSSNNFDGIAQALKHYQIIS